MTRAAAEPALAESHGSVRREEVAEELLSVAFADEPWARAVRFCTTASEAIDLGLALAQAVSGREPLASRERAYHGPTGLAREVSTIPALRGGIVRASGDWRTPPRGADVRVMPAPTCGLSVEEGRDADACHRTALNAAPDLLQDAAAFIADYGSGGVYPCSAYQDELAEIGRAADARWLQDEAITGFGRTGRWFAFQRGTERPDFVALGKGLTAGYAPGGALILSESMVAALDGQRWATFSTWRGHTLSIEAISATLRVITNEALIERAASLGALLSARLGELVSTHPSVARVVGEGTVWNVELTGPAELSLAEWDGAAATGAPSAQLRSLALERGLLLRPLGPLGMWLLVPFTISESALEHALVALDESLSELDAEAESMAPAAQAGGDAA
jgi:4-aminobutyrate aminotransferase-like enzyme